MVEGVEVIRAFIRAWAIRNMGLASVDGQAALAEIRAISPAALHYFEQAEKRTRDVTAPGSVTRGDISDEYAV